MSQKWFITFCTNYIAKLLSQSFETKDQRFKLSKADLCMISFVFYNIYNIYINIKENVIIEYAIKVLLENNASILSIQQRVQNFKPQWKVNNIQLYNMNQEISQISSTQALFDICLTVGSIRNIATDWTPRFSFSIYFELENSKDFPCPYQILPEKKSWNSSIDLTAYNSGSVMLGPMQEKQINQCCTFRSSLKIQDLQEKNLLCFVQIITQTGQKLTLRYIFQSNLGLLSFIPIFQVNLGIFIQAKVQTQLLGIRAYKNHEQDRNQNIYSMIDYIFRESKRLTKKIKKLQDQSNYKNQSREMYNTETSLQKNHEQKIQSQIYKQFTELRSFKQSRIFRKKPANQHRQQLLICLNKIKERYLNQLQINWQDYLKHLIRSNIKDSLIDLKRKYVCDFACEIKNKIIRNKGLEGKNSCPVLIGKIKNNIEGFNLIEHNQFPEVDSLHESIISDLQFYGKHLVVVVHGFGASSLGMALIQRSIRYYYPNVYVMNSRANQLVEENTSIYQMGRNLAIEIQSVVQRIQGADQDLQISFIGHSLGGLVVRSALTFLEPLKYSMSNFISLSTPHLGHISHENKLAKIGMIAINTFEKTRVIDQLLLKDENDPRLSLLYVLSTHSGLSWFKTITLYGCKNDGYVSLNSALVNYKNQQLKKVAIQMAHNLRQIMKPVKVLKYQVKFEHQKTNKPDIPQILIGRTSHIAFANHQSFINCFIMQKDKYLRSQPDSYEEDSY